MKYRFKKIYIEITNACNLSCSFCIKNKREVKYLTIEEFKIILNKINGYTKYIYLHILGEPLIHPKINEFIDLASSMGYSVNITTNGYFIDKIKDNANIRQVNISIHSYDSKYQISLDKYLDNIYKSIAILLKNKTYINLRIWTHSKYYNYLIDNICKHYNVISNGNNIKLSNNLYLNIAKEFIWPDINNNYYKTKGTCYGLIDHIGVLVSGIVVPCCLDANGYINLGNIYDNSLEEILKNERVNLMINGFKNKIKVEEYCKHCQFLDK